MPSGRRYASGPVLMMMASRTGVTEVSGQPVQVGGVSVLDGGGELDLDGEDLAVVADDDQVDFVVAIAGAQVADGGFGSLRRYPHAQGGQGLEEVPEHGARLGAQRLAVAVEEGTDAQPEQSRGQGGVGQVVLGCLSQPGQGVARWPPRGDWVEGATAHDASCTAREVPSRRV